MLIFSFDIGGSSIKHGLVEIENGHRFNLVRKGIAKLTSNNFDELKDNIIDILKQAIDEHKELNTIAISTTGSVNLEDIVISAGHFKDYKNVSWRNIITSQFERIKTVTTVNDGRASAWAEYKSNENEVKSHIHVVVGTGVGGGLIHNNELLLGDSGQAGYIGHMKITDKETIICSCEKQGCLETLASSRAIVQFFKELNLNSNENIKFETIVDLASKKDSNAILALKKGAYWLGVGIGNCMNILNPSVVSIGGGVVTGATSLMEKLGEDIYLDSVFEGVKYSSHKRIYESCCIRKGNLGNDGGLIGVALLGYSRQVINI